LGDDAVATAAIVFLVLPEDSERILYGVEDDVFDLQLVLCRRLERGERAHRLNQVKAVREVLGRSKVDVGRDATLEMLGLGGEGKKENK
jgi:hypothetical protein